MNWPVRADWTQKQRRWLWYLLLGAFVLRLFLLGVIGQPWNDAHWKDWIWTWDTDGYVQHANDLADGHQDNPSFRLPGYPVFLLLTRDLLGWPYAGTIVVQQLLTTACGLVIALMLVPLVGSAALYGVAFFLFEPFGLFYSFKVLPETVAIGSQVIATWLFLLALKRPFAKQLLYVGAIGVVLTIGAFNKPVLIYAYAGFVLLLLILSREAWWKRLVLIAVLICVVQLPLTALRHFNKTHFGYTGLSTQEAWEKSFRAMWIRDLATLGYMRDTPIRNELDSMIVASGFDKTHPNWALYDSVCNSVTRRILKTYTWPAVKYEFVLSYMFFQPGTQAFKEFFLMPVDANPNKTFIGNTKNIIGNFLSRFDSPWSIVFILFSLVFSGVMIVSYAFTLPFFRNADLRPVVWSITGWLAYSVALIGPYAQARYRVTFAWALCMSVSLAVYRWNARTTGKTGGN